MTENSEQPIQTGGAIASSAPKKKRSWMKILGIIAIAIVVLFVGASFFVNSATKAPVAVANQFVNDIQAGNAAGAYALFSSEAQTTVTPAQFDSIVAQVGPILSTTEKITSRKINAATGSAVTSEITYEIKGTDGKTYVVIVNLTKVNSDWKVLNFDSKAK
ncbi:MAG TPA: hypothetical protein VF307_06015 [Candidatus Nanopelagicaceae bacterium]